MTAIISPEIKKQFFDANGSPLSGGKLFVYTALTTDLAPSYTTSVGDVANTNPIILDSRGELGAMFLNTGDYKFVLKDSLDVVIFTQDGVSIRDISTEFDTLSSTVTGIEESLIAESSSEGVISGKSSANSTKAKYLVPVSTDNQVKVLATETDLKYFVEGAEVNLTLDAVVSGLSSPPITNNTAMINDASLADEPLTKTLGEYGTSIPYDTEGAEITSRDGTLQAFKIAGASTGYFIGRIDDTLKKIHKCERGCFFDSSNNEIERVAFSDNDVLTLMKLTYLYLKSDLTFIVSYNEPYVQTTEPTSPVDGDMWYNFTKWQRYASTVFVDAECTPIGLCIQDENDKTVGARPVEYYANRSSENTFELEYVSATKVRSKSRNNFISVNGVSLKFIDNSKVWDITSDLEAGQAESADTDFYCYIKENGDSLMSKHGPLDRKGSMRGLFHPYENYRYVGKISNNGTSNFNEDSIESDSVTSSSASGSSHAIGDVKASMLSLVNLQAELDVTWILADGQDVTGSDYAVLTGLTVVPDMTGRFLRGKGANNPDGDLALGAYTADKTAKNGLTGSVDSQGAHTHTINGNAGVGGDVNEPPRGNAATVSAAHSTNSSGAHTHTVTIGAGDNETAPDSITVNYFIKINR